MPYDSQPVFFLYPRPKYRKDLLKLVNRRYEDLRKLGEKTIELAGAYAQINSFLNELQFVLNRNAQQYGYTYNPGSTTTTNTYNPYNPYGTTDPNLQNNPLFGLQTVPMLNHLVEGLARSFNINLPANCWGSNTYGGSSLNSGYSSYSSGYSTYNNSYSSYGTSLGNSQAMDFVNRAQCVARSVSLEEFDLSVTKMWQQGGIFLMAELQRKYPQIAYWISIAAAAVDFIVRVFQKEPLRIVPTMLQTADGQVFGGSRMTSSGTGTNSYAQSYASPYTTNQYQPNQGANNQSKTMDPNFGKVSLFADSQPSEGQSVTAYPIVLHKWQSEPDPEVISLPPPVLAEQCLHSGINILKNTQLDEQLSQDKYSRNFRLVLSDESGYRKEFTLKKNLGLGGWELNIAPEELNQLPKMRMNLESELVGSRGFNEIRSPKFSLPLSLGGTWRLHRNH